MEVPGWEKREWRIAAAKGSPAPVVSIAVTFAQGRQARGLEAARYPGSTWDAKFLLAK